jgi:hypothetical protein
MSRKCPFPEKEPLTKVAATNRARSLNWHAFDGRRVQAYRCPGGGHHHVGHYRPSKGRKRW